MWHKGVRWHHAESDILKETPETSWRWTNGQSPLKQPVKCRTTIHRREADPYNGLRIKKMMQLTRYTLRMQMTWLVLPQRRSNKNCGAGGWNGRMATKLPRIYRVPSIKPMLFFILMYSVYWTYLPACPYPLPQQSVLSVQWSESNLICDIPWPHSDFLV